jgi:hypothetical protein
VSSVVPGTFIEVLLSLNNLLQVAYAPLSFFMFTNSFNLVSTIRDFLSSTNYINMVHVLGTTEKKNTAGSVYNCTAKDVDVTTLSRRTSTVVNGTLLEQ